MGVSRASNGIVTAAFGIGGLVAGLLTGYISDRTQNRVGPQICASFLYMAAGIVLFFAEHFYQIVMFRLVLGFASSIADTMLFTTVADVYPPNLLGFKIAVIFVFDNIGNMIGPLLGGKIYEKMGVGGVAIIAISLGVIELIMVVVFVRNSLDIRRDQVPESPGSLESIAEQNTVSTIVSNRHNMDNQSDLRRDSNASKISIFSITRPEDGTTQDAAISEDATSKNSKSMNLLRLILQLAVAGPTVAIFVSTGMQSVIETILPLRLFDRFGYSPATIGISFLIVGGVLIVAMPAVGYLNDKIVAKYGNYMRYYAIAIGALVIFISQIVMALAGSYPVLIFGYSLFAISSMMVIVPAQSAFGDFINASESPAMAQCYSLGWIAEGLANMSLPPIASSLYAAAGFLTMLLSMSAVLCVACALSVLLFPICQHWKSARQGI
ncbi:hypothetical protein H4S08_001048 [Coemansia sp. RSA 1365]|nr:hypothetical protein H4S08_001048 [Coemansia sp. RSA 1365]